MIKFIMLKNKLVNLNHVAILAFEEKRFYVELAYRNEIVSIGFPSRLICLEVEKRFNNFLYKINLDDDPIFNFNVLIELLTKKAGETND